MVAATKCIPEMPYTSCDPVRIMDAQPKTLFVKFKTMNTRCPTVPYRILIISRDVCA